MVKTVLKYASIPISTKFVAYLSEETDVFKLSMGSKLVLLYDLMAFFADSKT